jgi:pyruvate kinase
MSQIIIEAERSTDKYSVHFPVQPIPGSIVDSIQFSAARIAQHTGAVAIACVTHSGKAARTLAKYRPVTPIIAVMDNEASLRKLNFFWGVRGVIIPKIVATDDIFGMIEKVLINHQMADVSDLLVITAGIPTLGRGTTNTVKVHKVGAPIERVVRHRDLS